MTGSSGVLFVVGTPIGNLGDLSERARSALESADVIACEDTRRTGRLLQLAGISKRPLLVANEHTELARVPAVIERLARGESVALVSDAGMPAVSDPGQRLVAAVVDAGYEVDVIPGPTAMTAALVLSGLPTDRFAFDGFLARKGQHRTNELIELANRSRTTVIYEAPKRVAKTLQDLAVACGGERRVAVVRELTKLHQEVVRGKLVDVQRQLVDVEPRGEYVIVVDGAPPVDATVSDDQLREQLRESLANGSTTRDAVSEVVTATGAAKRRVYELAVGLAASG